LKPWRKAACALASLLLLAAPAAAQEDTAEPQAAEDAAPAEPVYSAEELDELTAPVALYPDALLTQVFVAATYPLEIVKAARWIAENADLAEDARADAAAAEGWDASVTVLAAGFPDVITRMADDLDWTETLGDAVLVQTDDVMDSVQRQRARAAAVGNLESNEAQAIVYEDNVIAIEPADPEVVYVPAYDAQTVYTQPAAAAPVVVTEADDDGYSSGELVATGLIAFGAGMVVNEVFDDDDDWDDYWRGPPRIDWDDGNFYPRPGRPNVNVDGDVNINVDRDGVDIDRGQAFRPDRDRQDRARDKIASRGEGGARDRLGDRAGGGSRDAARDRLRAGGGSRDAARAKLKARSEGGGGKLARPAGGGERPALKKGGGKASALKRDGGGLTSAKKAKLRAAPKAKPAALKRPKAAPKRAAGGGKPKLKKGGGGKKSALKRGGGGGRKAKAAKNRGGGKFKRR
jgi:hypothetical protein